MSSNSNDSQDEAFSRKIQSTLETVKAWEDPDLLAACRATIPFAELRNDTGKYSEPRDLYLSSNNTRFVQRLCRYFRDSMTWVNQPSCRHCGTADQMSHLHVRPAETADEKQGLASRVEVYDCALCKNNNTDTDTTTTFPRYNSARTLLQTRRGRCGEYANLFGLYCRAAGLTTRYVLDWTDHVWTEVCITDAGNTSSVNHWIMADGCEGVIDENSMYEQGWGKQLSYVIGLSVDHVIDVTSRYTRQFAQDAFMARRRAITSSEVASQHILKRINESLLQQSTMSPKQLQLVQQQWAAEEEVLHRLRQLREWDEFYANGRISGSMAWKVARGEAGNAAATNNNSEEKQSSSFYVESFWPTPPSSKNNISSSVATTIIVVQPQPSTPHGGIVVNGTACGMGGPKGLSVVVLSDPSDYVPGECILQSRSVSSLADLADFIDMIPDHRVVIINGAYSSDSVMDDPFKTKLARLGGFDVSSLPTPPPSSSSKEEGGDENEKKDTMILYAGQVAACPDWATFRYSGPDGSPPSGFVIRTTTGNRNQKNHTGVVKLRTHRNTKPARIVGRVPETIMPLQTQLLASFAQKRLAFENMMEKDQPDYCCGYTTKPGSPIFLLGPNAYPFERVGDGGGASPKGDDDNCWQSFVRLPSQLVSEDDVGVLDKDESKTPAPAYQVPVDVYFFQRQLGNQLLVKQPNGVATAVDTATALENARLVAFYFSAHWCGPCRTFSPRLAEMYSHLKSEFPTHGLEIVFVSSDRDQNSFDQYYQRTMPWLAIPFQNLASYKQLLSVTYGVQGIPALVVLDAISGQIVVSAQASRREVMGACNRGEEAIEALLKTWIQRVPSESQEMIEMLELSCRVDEESGAPKEDPKIHSYLYREVPSLSSSSKNDDTAAKIKVKFAELVNEGLTPNEAAAKAIEYVSSQPSNDSARVELQPGTLNGEYEVVPLAQESLGSSPEIYAEKIIASGSTGKDDIKSVLSTALKYLANAKREPWTPKFRTFKLSNKIADRIVRVSHGLELLQSCGLDISCTQEDFIASIPLAADVEKLHDDIAGLLDKHAAA